MKRLAALLIVALVAGCASDEPSHVVPTPPTTAPTGSSAAVDTPYNSKPILVTVLIDGRFSVGGYAVTDADIPELVHQWRASSALIQAVDGAKFSDVLRAQADLKSAGVMDVTISQHTVAAASAFSY